MKVFHQLDKYEMGIVAIYVAVSIEEQPHMISDTAEAGVLLDILNTDRKHCLDAIAICEKFIADIEGGRSL